VVVRAKPGKRRVQLDAVPPVLWRCRTCGAEVPTWVEYELEEAGHEHWRRRFEPHPPCENDAP
jgi:hypothetical protein